MSTDPSYNKSSRGSLERAPVIGVVRTDSPVQAARQARWLAAAGLELVEITFTVPHAVDLVRELLTERTGGGPPWIGMGTVTTPERGREALAAGAEFLVTPNVDTDVAGLARAAGVPLVMGALTPSEIVAAHRLGADLVKVYPLPPVGGPQYLATVRGPLGDIPMLAAGGFGIEEIPAYAQAGARGFGLAASLFGSSAAEIDHGVRRALTLARGERTA